MTVERTASGAIVRFGRKTRKRIRVFFVIQALVAIGSVLTFIMLFDDPAEVPLVGWLFTAGFITVYVVVSYRFLQSATLRESLRIEPATLSIAEEALFGKKESRYATDRISHMAYLGRQHSAAHPLSTGSFDYLGFDTQQQVVDAVTDEGNFSFSYDSRMVRFGRGVYSWEAEELTSLFVSILGTDLQVAAADKAFMKQYGLDTNPDPTIG